MNAYTSPEDEVWLTPAEVAHYFKVSPITVRNWANAGKLKAEITPGKHRRFAQSEVERFAAELGIRQRRAPRILIVDDDNAVVTFLEEILGDIVEGAEFILAHDGFEAGALVQEHIPQLIFMDIMMPGLNGDSACRFVKRHEKTRHIPVIAMTGYSSAENVEKMHKAGAVGVLKKPFDLMEIERLVKEALNLESAE